MTQDNDKMAKREDFLAFMNRSVSNFLAVDTIVSRLRAAGFQELRETDPWAVKPGSRCYVVKTALPWLLLWPAAIRRRDSA